MTNFSCYFEEFKQEEDICRLPLPPKKRKALRIEKILYLRIEKVGNKKEAISAFLIFLNR